MSDCPVLLVGGTSGIGTALRERLLSQGQPVLCASRSAPSLPDQPALTTCAYDASDPSAELALPEALAGLVYLPGTMLLRPFRQLRDEDFLADFEINLLGAVRAIRAAVKPLQACPSGPPAIVLLSTVAVRTGMRFHASISAAKGAVEGLTRALAAELAPRVRVNAVAPSLTETPLAERLLSNDQRRDAAEQRHPLRRIGRPDDVAAAIAWLLSAEASWVTGQILGIDGGLGSLQMV